MSMTEKKLALRQIATNIQNDPDDPMIACACATLLGPKKTALLYFACANRSPLAITNHPLWDNKCTGSTTIRFSERRIAREYIFIKKYSVGDKFTGDDLLALRELLLECIVEFGFSDLEKAYNTLYSCPPHPNPDLLARVLEICVEVDGDLEY